MRDKLIAFLTEQGYRNLRVINGEVWGTLDYVFTRAICKLNADCVELRYCYESRDEAVAVLAAWDGTLPPPGQWVKAKGRYPDGTYADDLNPAWCSDVHTNVPRTRVG